MTIHDIPLRAKLISKAKALYKVLMGRPVIYGATIQKDSVLNLGDELAVLWCNVQFPIITRLHGVDQKPEILTPFISK